MGSIRDLMQRLLIAAPSDEMRALKADVPTLDRRGFLLLAGKSAAVAGAVALTGIDPEQFLWTPQRQVVVVAPLVRSGNTFLTIDIITREALKVLEASLRQNPFHDRVYAHRAFERSYGVNQLRG